MMLERLSAIVLAVPVFFLIAPHADAATAGCAFEIPSYAATETDEGATSTAATLRQDILRKVAACASADASALKATLRENAPITADREIERVYSDYLNELERAETHYGAVAEQVSALSIQGIKEFSRELLEWRQRVYAPLVFDITNFLMWLKNQNLIETAEFRLLQMKQLIARKQQRHIDEVRQLAFQAENNLLNAQRSHRQARQTFVDSRAPDDFVYLIRSSLISLAETYKTFFHLSQSIERLPFLPQ